MEASGSYFKARCLFAWQDKLLVSEMFLPSFVESFEKLLSDQAKVWLISNLELKVNVVNAAALFAIRLCLYVMMCECLRCV